MGFDVGEKIIIPDENGEEHLFETLFTFTVDETNHSYIALVPFEQKDEDEVEVYAFRYEEGSKDDDLTLYEIESDEEWELVEEMLHTVAEEDELN
ncbi:MAG TPA: DUF1292 domain-containing protein [Bacillota bacterium]|nr:DUF1292 domain-containing protein [Bacillota bacterium]